MKLDQILITEEAEAVSITRTDSFPNGKLSYKKTIKVPYSKLVELFGEPTKLSSEEDGEYEWILDLNYEDGETRTVIVYDDNLRPGVEPFGIDTWRVSAERLFEVFDLEEYIKSH